MTEITSQILNQIQENPRVKRRLAFEHPFWFSLLYLKHHFNHSLAPFQLEMFHIIQKPEYSFVAIMAFRESGKSTIMNMANILWSILGKPGKKFVVIIGKTQEQAKSHFASIKAELENNELLREDFGPFAENAEDLKRLSLEFVYHGSKIMSVTREQSIRGLKYGPFRPDLIIGDDLEDISSVFDHKETEILYERFEKEIIPLGSSGTRIVILGNLISAASFMMKLKEDISNGRLMGIFRTYPLLDDNGKNLWESKYPDKTTIQNLRAKLSWETWKLEYLLTFDAPAYCDEPLGELPDPLDKDAYLAAVKRLCGFKLSKIANKYRPLLSTITPQGNIINQMREFSISAPTEYPFEIRWPGDPLYEIYREFADLKRQVEIEYKEGLIKTIHAQADEGERRKEKI